jgi:hypothetical protein
MGTPLNSGGGGSGPPSLKLRNAGDHADVAVVDVATVPLREYETGNKLFDRNGNERTQIKVTAIYVGGKGVIPVNKTEDRPAEADEVTSIFFARRDRWDPDLDETRGPDDPKSWGAAVEAIEGGLQVGDVARWVFEREVPGKGSQPRKIRTVRLRHPRPEEAERSALCEKLHAEGTQHTSLGGGNEAPPPVDDDGYYEEPF